MLDTHQIALLLIAVAGSAACVLMMRAAQEAEMRGVLEWRRGRRLVRDTFPGPFRLGVVTMQGAGLGFLLGAVRALAGLLDTSV